jgi:hypothetical protein
MDSQDEIDRVVPIPVPEPDVDQPLPIVLAKDGALVLSYKAWVGRKNSHIIVTFYPAFGQRFGPPGRAGLAAHPLAARGLKKDGVFEVKGSSWVSASYGGKGKHYAFAFKDALFECVAEGFGSETIDEHDDVVRLMARRLYK